MWYPTFLKMASILCCMCGPTPYPSQYCNFVPTIPKVLDIIKFCHSRSHKNLISIEVLKTKTECTLLNLISLYKCFVQIKAERIEISTLIKEKVPCSLKTLHL